MAKSSYQDNLNNSLQDEEIISQYIDKSELNSSNEIGSYKLSRAIVDRLLGDTIDVITYQEGRRVVTTMPNVTDCELKLLIFLTQICNNKGQVKYVTCQEVTVATSMSTKSYYNAINGLVNKHYIQLKRHNKGNYDITILSNEFTTKKHFKRGYINTNNNIFIPGTALNQQFNEIGLNAKKTLLYIFINYNRKRGYKFTTKTLAAHLGVQSLRIHRYLSSCKNLLGSFYKKNITFKGVVVCVKPNTITLISNQSIYDDQWTHQKRMFYKFLTNNHITILLYGDDKTKQLLLHSYLNKLYNILALYGSKIGRYKTLHTIFKALLYHNALDIGKIKLISKMLSNTTS